MLGYREEGKSPEGITTCPSVKSSSSKTGSIQPLLHVPVHDLIQEELERRAVKILSHSQTKRVAQHLVSFTLTLTLTLTSFKNYYVDENRNNAVGQEQKDLKADVLKHQQKDRWEEILK